jgi:hypothetical protein
MMIPPPPKRVTQELDFDEFSPEMLEFLEAYRATEKSKKDAKLAAKKVGNDDTMDDCDDDDDKEAEGTPTKTEEFDDSVGEDEDEDDQADKDDRGDVAKRPRDDGTESKLEDVISPEAKRLKEDEPLLDEPEGSKADE